MFRAVVQLNIIIIIIIVLLLEEAYSCPQLMQYK